MLHLHGRILITLTQIVIEGALNQSHPAAAPSGERRFQILSMREWIIHGGSHPPNTSV